MKDLKEYSKQKINAMLVLWFVGAFFGMAVVIVELVATLTQSDGYGMTVTVHLPELLTYIGAPVGGGIVGYLLKSGFENNAKIIRNTNYHQAENLDNFGGNYGN